MTLNYMRLGHSFAGSERHDPSPVFASSRLQSGESARDAQPLSYLEEEESSGQDDGELSGTRSH